MKKSLIYVTIISLLFLVGCSATTKKAEEGESSKLCKIEVRSAKNDELLAIINDQSTVQKLLATYDWEETDQLPDDLIPEYTLIVYQEKTALLGQDPNATRDYEIIETLITYQNSPYVQEVISGDVIKNMDISEDFLTFYYIAPDNTFDLLYDMI